MDKKTVVTVTAILFVAVTSGLAGTVHQPLDWMRPLGYRPGDQVMAMTFDADHNTYLAGSTDVLVAGGGKSEQSSHQDAVIQKLDPHGRVIWTRQFGSGKDEVCTAVVVDSKGVYITGKTAGALAHQKSAGAVDGFIKKYDFSGREIWTRQIGTEGNEDVQCLAFDPLGNILVGGSTTGTLPGQLSAGGSRDAFIMKLDPSGNVRLTVQYGTSGFETTMGLAADMNGKIHAVGYTSGTFEGQTRGGGLTDAYIHVMDPVGKTRYMLQFGSSDTDLAKSVVVDDNDQTWIVGDTRGPLFRMHSGDHSDVFYVKLDSAGRRLFGGQFGNPAVNADDRSDLVLIDPQGNLWISGSSEERFPGGEQTDSPDLFVTVLNANGHVISFEHIGPDKNLKEKSVYKTQHPKQNS